MKHKLHIVGFALDGDEKNITSSQLDGDVATLNDFYNFVPNLKPNKIFQIHKCWNGKNNSEAWRNNLDWKDEYNKTGAKVYVVNLYDGLFNQILFDEEKAYHTWGKCRFQSTVDYILYTGLFEGYTEIIMHGIKMSHSTEYEYQMPSCAYNVRELRRLGVKVTNKHESGWTRVDWDKIHAINMSYSEMRICE